MEVMHERNAQHFPLDLAQYVIKNRAGGTQQHIKLDTKYHLLASLNLIRHHVSGYEAGLF